MDSYEKILDYLYEKGFALNNKSPYEKDKYQESKANNQPHILVIRQNEFNNIMHEIANIKKCIVSNKDNPNPLKPISVYFDEQIYKILNNIVVFDQTHPLFGYKPFADKLLVFYIENKQYETCMSLKNEIYTY